jgi:predicted CxxxxCH...CXXCH cytochrome family protein
LRAARGLFLVLVGVVSFPAAAAPPTNDDCLTCHAEEVERADGRKIAPVGAPFAASIHGEAGVSCVDCHADLAKAELPHAEKLARVDCSPCHEAEAAKYAKSWHAKALLKSPDAKGAVCSSCHGTHDILPSKDPRSRTNHFNVPATCLACHGNAAIFSATAPQGSGEPSRFGDSIHGAALSKAGLSVAPNCATCHGAHEILRPSNPEARTSRARVPGTCGTCHAKILSEFDTGVHAEAARKGNPRAPVCIDCHSAHEVQLPGTPAWKVEVIKECGTCHAELIETYRDTYHGQVTALGFTRVATCADCHGAHAILAPGDPNSSVSRRRILETCRKCHPTANASFTAYQPHANPHNRKDYPFLYYTAKFMKWLLVGVFSFFGIHTLLWFPRSLQVRRDHRRNHGA